MCVSQEPHREKMEISTSNKKKRGSNHSETILNSSQIYEIEDSEEEEYSFSELLFTVMKMISI